MHPTPPNTVSRDVNRVDGKLKVTGAARYSSDFVLPDLTHAVLVTSTITKGRIRTLDTKAALDAPGVLAVISHLNAPKLPYDLPDQTTGSRDGNQPLPLFQDDLIRFNGAPIAVVVAETAEQATFAASLIVATYQAEPFAVKLKATNRQTGTDPKAKSNRAEPRGDAAGAMATAPVTIEQTYTTPVHMHNPMGMLATTAVWTDDKLTLYDTTQGVSSVRDQIAGIFGLDATDVQVICPFTGGAFGCTLRMWHHVVGTAMAARAVNRPVKLVLTRSQMFTSNGHRPESHHEIRLGATRDGQLTALIHKVWNSKATYFEHSEPQINATRLLYTPPNIDTPYKLVPLDIGSPTWMRAPGENTGVHAIECAMDELAYALGMDPVALRLKNYSERDVDKDLPWSSKGLRACLEQGAAAFGWAKRNPKPRSMQDGDWLVGYGMASASYPVNRAAAAVLVKLHADGTALVRNGSTDIGVGTYTAMTQIAANSLGLPLGRVRFELGDSAMPHSPPQGGSRLTASVGSAVHDAGMAMRTKVIALAVADEKSPLYGADPAAVTVVEGRVQLPENPERGETYSEILRRSNEGRPMELTVESKPDKTPTASSHAWGARFAEVQVHQKTGEIRVIRVMNATEAGRIVNTRQTRSQLLGGTIMGLGMALLEEAIMDERYGRFLNHDLAEYHVPVHADAPLFESILIEEGYAEPSNPIGVKGVGEIAAVGVAPAIANALFHATGKRVRDLPITIDKLLA